MGFLCDVMAKIANHRADLDAHTYNLLSEIRTGEYFSGGCGAPRSWTYGINADYLYATPFCAARAMSIDRLAVYISTARDGKVARLGVYRNGSNSAPGELVVDGGEVSVGTTGLKAAAVSEALAPGLYWLAILSDGDPTVKAFSQNQCTISAITTMSDGYNYETCWKRSYGFAALPDPFGTPVKAAYITIPGLMVRLASLD